MSQIKGEQHLTDLNKTVNFICEKCDDFERDRAEKEKIINELQENVNDMSATIESFMVSRNQKAKIRMGC